MGRLLWDDCCCQNMDAINHFSLHHRNDRGGVLHVPVGKVHFEKEQLLDNVGALVSTLLQMRPKGVKGGQGASGYLLRAHMSSTMGKSVPVSIGSLVGTAVDRQLV